MSGDRRPAQQEGPRTVTQAPQNGEPTEKEWRELARQASEEEDSEMVIDLAQQIVEKFDEGKQRKGPRLV